MTEFEYDHKMVHLTFFNVSLTQFFTKYNIVYCRVDLKMANLPVFVKPDLRIAIPRTDSGLGINFPHNSYNPTHNHSKLFWFDWSIDT